MGESEITRLWRERLQGTAGAIEPVTLTLPSGMPVKARRIDLHTLFSLGSIPDALTPLVVEWFETPKRVTPDKVDETLVASINEHLADYYRVRNIVWRACVVDPVFWETAEESLAHPDWLPLSAVSNDDRQYLFDWAQGVSETIAGFFLRVSGRSEETGPGEDQPVGVVAGRAGVSTGPAGDVRPEPADGPVAVRADSPVSPDLG